MTDNDQVDAFFDRLDETDDLELMADEVETRTVSIRTVSPRRSSILVEIDEESRKLVTADVPIRACIAGATNSPLVCASFDRADRDLARLHIRPADARDRRESIRIQSPSNASASLLDLTKEDEDERTHYETKVLDIGLGGIGVSLPSHCILSPDQEVELELEIGSDWSLTCTGRIVYIKPFDESSRLRAGVEFGQLSEAWRQSLLRLLSGDSDEEM